MKRLLILGMSLFLSGQVLADKAMKMPAPSSPELKTTMADIESMLGLVPTFMKVYPANALPGAWKTYKDVELSTTTAVPGKYKELMGLAVAAQIPCHYCVYAHTVFAKLNGATTAEVQEAVALSAAVREWSAIINATQISMQDFRTEADAMFSYMKNSNHVVPKMEPGMSDTKKEMVTMMGKVPSFMESYPAAGLDGAWSNFKSLQAAETAIPHKYKDLIGLAVAAQVPCPYCVYFHRNGAKNAGATEQELAEAAAMSSITRRWSTVLNGNDLDMAQFKKEIGMIVKHVTKMMAKH